MLRDGKDGYFEAALSDFMFDVAAGGAIRHLVDRGYSVEQIMNELDYPVPRSKVEKAVYRYLTEAGVLVSVLPIEENEKSIMRMLELKKTERNQLTQQLHRCIEKNGIENSYIECPFGVWKKENAKKLEDILACLSSRERDYLQGILWEPQIMYHQLTDRMQEISRKLAKPLQNPIEVEWKFYFLKSKEIIVVK